MRIIIIDDEGITRQWLKKKIEEIDVNYHVTGEFTNGSQAAEYLEKQDADVVFTDIRMPIMDGLEFLSQIKDRKTDLYKIILSAYDEFHYVRQAMRLGAHEFILKPEITKEKLDETLKEAGRFLREKRKEKGSEMDSDLRFEAYYTEMLERETDEQEIRIFIEENQIPLFPENMVTVFFTVSGNQDKERIREVVKLYLEEERLSGCCMYIGKQEYVMIYNQGIASTRESVVNKMLDIIRKNLGVTCCAGVSVRKTGYRYLKEMFRQAEAAKENRSFFHEEGVQLYDNMKILKKDGNWYFTDEMKSIVAALKENKLETARQQTEDFLTKAGEMKKIYPAYLRTLCMEILSAYIQKIREYDLRKEEEEQVQYIEMRVGTMYKTLEELKDAVLAYQSRLTKMLAEKSDSGRYSIPVQRIIRYVEVHLKEKISLEQIAEEIHMNRTYISVLFKKETGVKFSDYLQKVRLENARELLEHTRMSMQEIAEETGFFDAAHLGRVFKENYQMTLLEYRRKNINLIQKDK